MHIKEKNTRDFVFFNFQNSDGNAHTKITHGEGVIYLSRSTRQLQSH